MVFQRTINTQTSMQSVFNTPLCGFWVVWFRIVVFGLLTYKLLSRDFTQYALKAEHDWSMYPAFIEDQFLDLPYMWDLATFHWLHWFIPIPSVEVLQIIQFMTIGFCALVMIGGRGKYSWRAVIAYLGMMYLWGYVWRMADTIYLPLQLVLVYCLASFKEPYSFEDKHNDQKTLFRPAKDYGQFFSIILICFCGYYFFSGLNKISQITLSDWFAYNFTGVFQHYYNLERHTDFPIEVLDSFRFILIHPAMNYILVPLVYISHLIIPIIFFKRKLIPQFFVFYALFHTATLAININFFTLALFWCVFLPVHRAFEKIEIKAPKNFKWTTIIRALDWMKRIDIKQTRSKNFSLKDKTSGTVYDGFYAARRLLWSLPLLWPCIPVIYGIYYFPYAHSAARWIKKATITNRE